MREQNREILYKKFNKGRFRPQDISQVWDIEEVIAYAKQLEKNLQRKNDLLEKKEKFYQEKFKGYQEKLEKKHGQLLDKNDQLREKKELITEKNGKIGELNYRLKKNDEQISLLESKLNQKEQQTENLLEISKEAK